MTVTDPCHWCPYTRCNGCQWQGGTDPDRPRKEE